MKADILFIALTFFNTLAVIIIFCGLCSERLRTFPSWHKVSMVLILAGLLSQIFRNITYLMTGESPSDATLPIWAFKDVGIDIIAFYYFTILVDNALNERSKKTAITKPVTRKPRVSTTVKKEVK
jgi:hypothetical protein